MTRVGEEYVPDTQSETMIQTSNKRTKKGQIEPPFHGFRVLGKRSFAAATAFVASVGLLNLAF
jgi:hypothetical protein